MTIAETIQLWIDGITKDMILKYDELGFRASGDWENSLETTLEQNKGSYKGQILGVNYTYWMEHGRKKGKFPPIAAIRKWIDDKGIQSDINKNSLAFLIARKIARQGTTIRPGIVSGVITQERIDELIKEVGVLFSVQVQSDVINTFK